MGNFQKPARDHWISCFGQKVLQDKELFLVFISTMASLGCTSRNFLDAVKMRSTFAFRRIWGCWWRPTRWRRRRGRWSRDDDQSGNDPRFLVFFGLSFEVIIKAKRLDYLSFLRHAPPWGTFLWTLQSWKSNLPTVRIEPGTTGWEARIPPLSYAVPPKLKDTNYAILNDRICPVLETASKVDIFKSVYRWSLIRSCRPN